MEFAEEFLNGLLNTLVLNRVSCLVFLGIDLEGLNTVEVLGKLRVVLITLQSVETVSFVYDIVSVVLKGNIGEIEIIFLAVE